MFPCRLYAALKLVDAHVLRLEDDVLRVVQLPVAREDPSFGLEALVEWCIRERCHDCKPGQVDLRLHRELGGLQEYVRVIVIEPEHEAPLQRDAMLMQSLDHLRITIGRVEALPISLEVDAGERLESHEQP